MVSLFDIFKISIGPSSSHTLGPWKASLDFAQQIEQLRHSEKIQRVRVDLYGSLALTGKGHGTDLAVCLGLNSYDPVTIENKTILQFLELVALKAAFPIFQHNPIPFNPAVDIIFHFDEMLEFHSNAMKCSAYDIQNDLVFEQIYYSVGGGFILKDGVEADSNQLYKYSNQIKNAKDLLNICKLTETSIKEVILKNEAERYSEEEVKSKLLNLWSVMLDCAYRGCHREGILPGGLNVQRRASPISSKLLPDTIKYANSREWIQQIKNQTYNFRQTIEWVSCFALAVNEENADFGKLVTAPTNGAAGVIPAVLLYAICLHDQPVGNDEVIEFLSVAGIVGSLFKEGATLSAAAGGCQAEIGVSSAMAAAGLASIFGASNEQILMAAEIAMEHHLGLTCDPIKGLVQVPCIERNSIGAMKAITAAQLALSTDPSKAKVTLDQVIKTMWNTAMDMNHKYKETAQGGLAIHVWEAEC